MAKVEISLDGGKTWSKAELLGESIAHTWRLWEFEWSSPSAGEHALMARTTDERGQTQPATRDPDHRGYMIAHVLPVPVEVPQSR